LLAIVYAVVALASTADQFFYPSRLGLLAAVVDHAGTGPDRVGTGPDRVGAARPVSAPPRCSAVLPSNRACGTNSVPGSASSPVIDCSGYR
jgi:hypothetical protein